VKEGGAEVATRNESLVGTLRRLHFLSGLPDEYLDRLAPMARTVSAQAGSVLFRQGDEAKSIHLIVQGNVSLEICAAAVGCKRILTLGAGEMLGWSPVVKQQRLTATARALSDIQAVELDAAQVLAFCESEPRFGYEFMRRTSLALAKRLNATRLQLLDVFGSEMPPVTDERVAE